VTTVPVSPLVFEPVVDLASGRAVAHQAVTGGSVSAATVALAAAAAMPTPLHIPVLASEISGTSGAAEALLAAASASGRSPASVVLQLTESEAVADLVTVRRRCARLRTLGFAVGVGDAGDQHASLRLVTEVRPAVVKTGAALAEALAAGSASAAAIAEALAVCCRRIGATLAASGVSGEEQLAAVRALGIGLGQGSFLAAATPQWISEVSIPRRTADGRTVSGSGPTMRDLMRRPVTAGADASGDEVRALFGADESLLTVVLADASGRPAGVVHRSRFMVAASGPFGHALNARRSALHHASRPQLVAPETLVREAARFVTARAASRIYDDLVVAGDDGICAGVVHVHDLLTAAHSVTIEGARSLDALTELPGGEAVSRAVRDRLAESGGVAVHWIEARELLASQERGGFGVAEDLIRGIARQLRTVAVIVAGSWAGHLGGGDFVLLTEREHAELAVRGLLSRLADAGGAEVAVATLDCPAGSAGDPDEVARQLAPVRQTVRQAGGPSWAVASAGQPGARLHIGRPPARPEPAAPAVPAAAAPTKPAAATPAAATTAPAGQAPSARWFAAS
jgi:EAL domain-containing protein (putative c-di-GMP-specific phosphodiesterase class I)/CBS domain-containing protein